MGFRMHEFVQVLYALLRNGDYEASYVLKRSALLFLSPSIPTTAGGVCGEQGQPKRATDAGRGIGGQLMRAVLTGMAAGGSSVQHCGRCNVHGDVAVCVGQIDTNGDGTLEWEEFSSFIVEMGMYVSYLSD